LARIAVLKMQEASVLCVSCEKGGNGFSKVTAEKGVSLPIFLRDFLRSKSPPFEDFHRATDTTA